MFSWKLILNAMLGGFVGKLLAGLFIAVCILLGFGPDEWAAVLVDGLMTVETARIAFVVLGALAFGLLVLSFFWKPTVHIVPPEPVPEPVADGQKVLERPAQTALTSVPIHIQRATLRANLKGGVTFAGSHNVTSLTDVGKGDFIVNFGAPFDGDYGVIPLAGNTDKYQIEAKTPSSVRLVFPDGDPERLDFRFEADNAPAAADMSAKIAAIDDALEILGYEKRMMKASRELQQVRAIWETEVAAGRNDEYLARLRSAKANLAGTIAEVDNLARRNVIFPDVANILSQTTNGISFEFVDVMIDNFKRLEPFAPPNTRYLFQRSAEEARPLSYLVDERRQTAENALVALRQNLAS